MPINHSEMKLGRLPCDPRRYASVPKLINYMADAHLPLIADACDYTQRMPDAGGALGNDQFGCCGFAGFGHLKQSICANLGIVCDVTEAKVLDWYARCTGWREDDPATDQGVVLLDAIDFFMREKLILAYARVSPSSDPHVAAGLELFGGLYTGWSLPVAWQDRSYWNVGPNTKGDWKPGSWGGHCISLHSYDGGLNTKHDTWGDFGITTSLARPVYCDEAYVFILPEWMDTTGRTIQGLDLASLKSDLELLR